MAVNGVVFGLGDAEKGGLVFGEAGGVEEVGGFERANGKHVVVEVDEVFGEAGEAVEIELDGVGGEGGEVFLWDEAGVVDKLECVATCCVGGFFG